MSRLTALLLTLALAGCGNGLSSQRAKALAGEHWHTEGISIRDLGLCLTLSEACVAAAECIEPVANDFLQERETAWRSFGVPRLSERGRLDEITKHFPAFDAQDIQISDLTQHLQEGVQPGATVRETAQITARLVPSAQAAPVGECRGFSQLLATIQQPAGFRAVFVGVPQTNGDTTRYSWRLVEMYPSSAR